MHEAARPLRPYNIRHRAAERIMPAAEKAGLGMVTIKAFARGENDFVDTCICGVISEAELCENPSTSWTGLTGEERRRLDDLAATTACRRYPWLENDWRHA